jgi:hypothetical protein
LSPLCAKGGRGRAAFTRSSGELTFERGQRDGDPRADMPAALVVNVFVGALWGVDEGIREGRIAPAGASRRLAALLLEDSRHRAP